MVMSTSRTQRLSKGPVRQAPFSSMLPACLHPTTSNYQSARAFVTSRTLAKAVARQAGSKATTVPTMSWVTWGARLPVALASYRPGLGLNSVDDTQRSNRTPSRDQSGQRQPWSVVDSPRSICVWRVFRWTLHSVAGTSRLHRFLLTKDLLDLLGETNYCQVVVSLVYSC